jgi:hypothetical protein
VLLAAGAIVLVLAGMVAFWLLRPTAPASSAAEGPVPADLMDALTSISPATLNAVGRGTARLPVAIRTEIRRNGIGFPVVTYIGAEYCPFCAAERWPLVIALSRFGELANLQRTRSAADDVYPSTATFTFVGSDYSSQLLAFDPVELQGNTRVNGRYPPLQTPTTKQEALLETFDAPPYVPSSSAGSIPFLDLAGQYIVEGASYDASVLQGRDWEAIATSLSDPASPQAQGILGTANVLTAAMCETTEGSPDDVCSQPSIVDLMAALKAIPTTGR